MKDEQIGPGLLAALRTGQRFKHLLQSLELDQVERLLMKARQPVRANASNRERLLRQKAWQLLPMMIKDGPATDVLVQWALPRMPDLEGYLLEDDSPLTWKHGLLARVGFGSGRSTLPSVMASRIDDLIAHRAESLEDNEVEMLCRTLRTLAVERRLDALQRWVEEAVAGAPVETLVHPTDNERTAAQILFACLRTSDWMESLVERWQVDLIALRQLVGHLGIQWSGNSARDVLGAVVEESARHRLIRAMADIRAPLVDSFDRLRGLEQMRRLVERLAPMATALDRERLQTALGANEAPTAGASGPGSRPGSGLLVALLDLETGRRTFEDVAPTLGAQLTYNLVDALRRNGLPAGLASVDEEIVTPASDEASSSAAAAAAQRSHDVAGERGEPPPSSAGQLPSADGTEEPSTQSPVDSGEQHPIRVEGDESALDRGSPAGGHRADEAVGHPRDPNDNSAAPLPAPGAGPPGHAPRTPSPTRPESGGNFSLVDHAVPSTPRMEREGEPETEPTWAEDQEQLEIARPGTDLEPRLEAGQGGREPEPTSGTVAAGESTLESKPPPAGAGSVSEPDSKPEEPLVAVESSSQRESFDDETPCPLASEVSGPSGDARTGQEVDGRGAQVELSAEPEGADSVQRAEAMSPAHLSGKQLAKVLLDAGAARRRQDMPLLVARLLLEERLDEAYWLARASQVDSSLHFQLVDALYLGVSLQPGFRAAEARLLQLFSEALPVWDELDRASALLLSAALVRPALMASATTEPTFLLEQLPQRLNFLPAMHRFVEVLTDFSKRRQTMSPTLFAGLRSRVEWEERKERLEKETQCWLEESPNRKVKYDAATRVWSQWVRPTDEGGDLRQLVSQAQSGTVDAVEIRERAADWAGENSFTRRLDQTDRAVNRRARRQPIKYGARDALKRLVDNALELVEEWTELHESNPAATGGGDEIGQETLARLEAPAAELAERLLELSADSQPLFLRAGAHWFRIVLLEVARGFASGSMRQSAEDPRQARRIWLYGVPGIGSEASLEDLGHSEGRTTALLRFIAQPLEPAKALHAHLSNGHIEAAKALLRLIEQGAEPRGDLSDAIQSKQRWWFNHAHETVTACLDDIEGYHLKGGLSLTQREDFNAEGEFLLRKLEDRHEEPREVLDELKVLAVHIEESVSEHRRQTHTERMRLLEELDAEGREIPPEAEALLEQAFAEDDLSVAIDLIARCRKSRSLQPSDYRPSRKHLEAFIAALPAIHPLAIDPQRARALLSKPGQDELSTFDDLSPALREQAQNSLASWQRLAGSRRLERQNAVLFADLGAVLRWLGYHEANTDKPRVIERQPGSPAWLHLQVEARLVSPLPRFGSRAGGLHDVIIVWGQASAEQIAQRIAEARSLDLERAITLIVTRALDLLERRELIYALRRKRFCPLVVDACLFTWLCGHDAEARREALFAVGLAGGYENPYTPTVAGGVPPEIFVGRQQDIERLWDRSGTCIVYGGRQLGKSALLRQVIRLYDRPEAEQFVLYEGTKNDAQVWEVVRRLLVRGKLLNKRTTNPHSIKDAIRSQLDENPRRRILLLLDECDDLLDADMRTNFDGVALLRDLMTETERRFKVVFAGLHNVQRFQRIPNQPLAHFGEPLCVGPLEPRAALELVERPLNVLGYRFEAPTLAHRILAHTNCHPSLLQLFCFSLVNELNRGRRPIAGTPPIPIRERDITSVYRSVDLGRNMRLRFDWTLNLDERYRAIGYAFAFQELNNAFTGEQRDGFSAAAALADVSHWWPRGFAQTDQDELEGLLDEMVGLGVLVKHGHRYRLRSPNILRLLGGPEDIIGELDRFQRIELRREPDRHVIHRVLPGTLRGIETSPLTLAQENRLLERVHGVDIIIGSDATRLTGIGSALEYLYGERATDEALARPITALVGRDADVLLEEVKDHYRRQSGATGLTLLIESAASLVDGNSDGIERIVDWTERLRTTERFVRVVVCVGPTELFALHRSGRMERLEERPVVSTYRLRRWRAPGLERYYNDAGINPPVRIEELMIRTGGWPCIVEMLALHAEKEPAIDKWPDPPLVELVGIDAIEHGRMLLELLSELSEQSDPMSVEMLDLMAEDIDSTAVRTFALCALDLSIVDGTIEELVAEPLLSTRAVRQ